jgi:hypothetical protein
MCDCGGAPVHSCPWTTIRQALLQPPITCTSTSGTHSSWRIPFCQRFTLLAKPLAPHITPYELCLRPSCVMRTEEPSEKPLLCTVLPAWSTSHAAQQLTLTVFALHCAFAVHVTCAASMNMADASNGKAAGGGMNAPTLPPQRSQCPPA